MAEMVRVNTRVSTRINDWLDNESEKTGVPKSTLIMLALEQQYKEQLAMQKMAELGPLLQKLDEIETELKKRD